MIHLFGVLSGIKLKAYGFLLSGAVIAVVVTGAYWKGWVDRGTREELRIAQLANERRVQATRIMMQAETLQALTAERDRLMEELENAARTDPDADRPALGAGSVQRLNLR